MIELIMAKLEERVKKSWNYGQCDTYEERLNLIANRQYDLAEKIVEFFCHDDGQIRSNPVKDNL